MWIFKKLVYELKRTRGIKPNESNWLLFASMVEAALLEFTGEYDSQRLYYGVNRFIDEWYKGDAWYGDGQNCIWITITVWSSIRC